MASVWYVRRGDTGEFVRKLQMLEEFGLITGIEWTDNPALSHGTSFASARALSRRISDAAIEHPPKTTVVEFREVEGV